MDTESPVVWPSWCYSGETTTAGEILDPTVSQNTTKLIRKRRMERPNSVGSGNITNNNGLITDYSICNNNNNNNVKSERLSPGNTDVSSRSRSVTPSSVSHPGTPPGSENHTTTIPNRNYSDFMRSLAARYNNTNPNDYFSAARNGFPPPIDPRFKPNFPASMATTTTTTTAGITTLPPKDPTIEPINNNNNSINNNNNNNNSRKPDLTALINPYSAIFPPPFEMTSTHALIAMMRTAKEAEIQNLLKNAKRQDLTTTTTTTTSSSSSSSPLDLSSAAGPPPLKRAKTKTSANSPNNCNAITTTTTSGMTTTTTTTTTMRKRARSESPHLQEDVSNWSVDDVCNFVSNIDICAEYSQNFRDQQIDGSGLPLLTEEHLITTMQMKLGPALKLRSILAKKLGSCNICLHCNHCHNSSGSPEPVVGGNTSDSGGTS